jgi:hypothetical protein
MANGDRQGVVREFISLSYTEIVSIPSSQPTVYDVHSARMAGRRIFKDFTAVSGHLQYISKGRSMESRQDSSAGGGIKAIQGLPSTIHLRGGTLVGRYSYAAAVPSKCILQPPVGSN